MAQITGILLAAGASRRFGGNKLSHTLPSGLAVAEQACRNLAQAVDRVLAVVRPGADGVAAMLEAAGARVVVCEGADSGMGASLACGIAAGASADAWLVALADMPWIAPQTVALVADALRNGAAIVAPCREGRRGHPVGFARHLATDLLALHGDNGAKSVIERHSSQLQLVEVADPGILRDVDMPTDLVQV
ncbi:nucleotidyltransferase family protein [Methylomonas sp. SURF-1]|uniref:Nucleotidyltransferase family protein n=1 Tax=Methylomonas aurea TaxID=2952224 RepID=A0ABT1UIW6_9GAMM|nr:nucleotidyltransferase family protein [Methylomonas sp. SURF-1]MCQ8181961.1 nucleotidyltransferase family protein [Methylomonas sp. SURF-1]